MLCFGLFDGVFFMLISVKMPTHIDILTFMIIIKFVLGCFKMEINKDLLYYRNFDGVFSMLICVRMPTNIGILTFIILINFIIG